MKYIFFSWLDAFVLQSADTSADARKCVRSAGSFSALPKKGGGRKEGSFFSYQDSDFNSCMHQEASTYYSIAAAATTNEIFFASKHPDRLHSTHYKVGNLEALKV